MGSNRPTYPTRTAPTIAVTAGGGVERRRFADAEAVHDHLRGRRAVGEHDVGGPLREDAKAVNGVEHRALTLVVAGNQIGHRQRGSGAARQPARQAAQLRRDGRQNAGDERAGAAMLQLAFGAPAGVHDAVADCAPLPHQRAALTQKPKTARVRRRKNAAAGSLRRGDLRQTQSGHERVEMDDVGAARRAASGGRCSDPRAAVSP